MTVRVTHFTTVHSRSDVRIHIKELSSLARNPHYICSLLVQDGLGDEVLENLNVVDTGARYKGRIARFVLGGWRMYLAVRRSKPEIAHFHDPELIPFALLLKLTGIRVIYDVHEDLPRQILSKPYLWGPSRKLIAAIAEAVERISVRFFDGIVAATPTIAERFPKNKTVLVQNFPILSEFGGDRASPYVERPLQFVYVGGITENRGAKSMVAAMAELPDKSVSLKIAGDFKPQSYEDVLAATEGWSRVSYLGWLKREDICALLVNGRAGLVILQPRRNYIDSLPVKMFEYMAAGLPVIASNFPIWEKIVLDSQCGLLVDPEDPNAVAQAMQWVLDNPKKAQLMGERGKKAALEVFNWSAEAKKLAAFYLQITKTTKA